jgi:hypothetical protein
MLNVKNLTDTMSRMELPDLQKYAAMHKNDPYIVTLALSIANQKKQMKAGQAGQAGMMPQPRVVDQQIAGMAPPPQQMAAAPQQQMLPEDTGIGQLPAQNMQNLAEGGIVAFEDGGQVPGYKEGGRLLSTYIDTYSKKYNVDPAVLSRIIQVESEGKTTAKNPKSTAHGAGQLLDDMWKKMGGGKRGDAETQVRNAAKLLRSNTDNFKNATGREPSASEAYVTWVLGDSTGRAVLAANPKASVEDVITKADPANAADIIKSNASIFKNKSVGDVTQWAANKTNLPSIMPVSTAQAAPPAPPVQATSSAPASTAPLTRLSDASIPTDYKKEQALQQAARDEQIKKLQSEGFLDKTSRVGKGIVGNLEAGVNALTGMASYPIGYFGAIATDPTGAAAAIQNKPEGAGFYDRMRGIQASTTYQPRTDVGELQAEELSKTLSFLPPFLAGPGSLRPSKLNALKSTKPTTTTKPGLPGIAESQTAKAAKAAEQLPLFPELETAPATAPAAAYPSGIFGPEPAVSAAVQAARAKQVAAKAALQKDGPEIGNRFFEPEPTTFPITPENAGIAAVQRNIIAKNKAAEAAARAEAARIAEAARAAEMPAKPAVPVVPAQEAVKTAESAITPETVGTPETVVTPEQTPAKPAQIATTLTEADMLERARAFELDQQKADIIRRNQDKVKAGLPGITNPVPVTGVEDSTSLDNGMNYGYEQAQMPELPKEDEKAVIAKLKEQTGATTGELKQQAADSGMDWNSFLIRFGLGLMAGESQYAAVNVGKAGLGALDAQLAEQKSRQAQAASLSDSELKKMQAKYYGSYAEAIERGAKEKDAQLQAETLVQQRMEKWLAGPGKIAALQNPNATAIEEERVRRAIYQQLGLNPIMATGAPAGQKLSYNPETGKIG